MTCIICKSEIPSARLEVAPATLTCSRDCSAKKARLTRRAAAQRWRDKRRQARLDRRDGGPKAAKKKGGRRG